MGKSRLLGEMLRAARERGFAAQRTLIFDFGTGKGQDAIRALAADLLGLPADATQDQRREAHEWALDRGLVAPEQGVFLADLLNLAASADERALYDAMDNERRNLGKKQTVTALVANASSTHPRVIAVEDVHWADALTLQQLAAIAAALRRVPALLVLTTRVEGDPLDSSWRMSAGGTPLMTVDVGPLPPEEAAVLAGTFTDAAGSVASACIERAGGNPLFLEQLLRHATEGADADAIPASIQSLVLARMDRLGPVDKRALLAAAILGQRFDIAPLRHLLGDPSYECSALLAHALVVPEQSGFLFAHALVQEGVYSSLLKPRKRELHRRAAKWFGDSDPVLHARHLDRAEDPGAPLALGAAARSQRAAFRYEAAMELVDRGLAVVADIGERFELSCLRGELLRDLGSIPESIAAFRNALEIASGDAQRCRAAIGLVEGLRVSEGLAEALVLLDQAQEAATRDGATADLARIHHLRGNIYFPLGRIEECRAEHEMGLTHALESGSVEAEARALDGLGDAAYAQGRMRSAYQYFSRCAELAHAHGFGRIEVATRSMAGCRIYFNEAREALKDGIEATAAAARAGHLRAELLGRTTCTQACLELGEWDRALEHVAHANRLAKRLGAKRFEAQNLEFEGRILHGRGERDKARSRLSEALTICRSVGTQFSGPKCIGALALTTDDPVEQRRLLDEGEAMLRRGAVSHNHISFYRDAMEVMLEQERWDDALRYAAAMEDYTRAEPLPLSELFVARARALSSWAIGNRDASARQALQAVLSTLDDAGLAGYCGAVQHALQRE
jgi:tetratricopeptide (TPR) repeat protein